MAIIKKIVREKIGQLEFIKVEKKVEIRPATLEELFNEMPESWCPTLMKMRGGWSCIILEHGKTIGASANVFPSPSEAVIVATKSAREYKVRHPEEAELVPIKGEQKIPEGKFVKRIIKKKP